MQLNIRKVVFMGLPIAAIALAVFLLSLGNGSSQKAHADFPHAGTNFSIGVGAVCDSGGTPTAKCQQTVGSSFTVQLKFNALGGVAYDGYDAKVQYSGVVNYVAGSLVQTGAGTWPDCSVAGAIVGGEFTAAGEVSTFCSHGTGASGALPSSTYTGVVLTLQFTCNKGAGAGTITLVAGNGNTDIVDSGLTPHGEAANEALTINCVPGPSATPIPPTPTPPPQPKVQKLPVLQNVFLTRQGAKIPPARCEDSTDVADLNETLNIGITSADPKNPSVFQQLGGFQFEARFDDKLVCVSVEAGPAWGPSSPGIPDTGVPPIVCLTTSAKGLIRFGCVTAGKGADLNLTVPAQPLAIIHVRPQEELYSQLRPNQDNGIPVQILNQGCNLTDEQGHVIPIFSCEDADITFRYLEGDVDGPDCIVNVFDAQNVAFRWGAAKGSLLFSSFLDLSPSGQIKGDGRIDIKDLQFVFGRLGSQGTDSKGGNAVCTGAADGSDAWPLQPPVNPKA